MPSLPRPELATLPMPTALAQLALTPPTLPRDVPKLKPRSPRSPSAIIADLEAGLGDRLSLLEWVYLLSFKPDWDARQPQERRLQTAQLIWAEGWEIPEIKQRLCWQLALYLDGDRYALARSLVETFSEFASAIAPDDLTVRVLLDWKQKNAAIAVAKLALETDCSPGELLAIAQLPAHLSIVPDILDCVVSLFCELEMPGDRQVNWLLHCWQEMSAQQQVDARNELLARVTPEIRVQFPQLAL